MTHEKCICSRLGKWTIIAVVLVLAVGVLSWATMEQRKSIAKTVSEMEDCKTFASCIEKAGLSGVLENDGPFTVFVPNNAAFEKMNPEELTKLLDNKSALTAVLLYHMVPKVLTAAEMNNLGDCMTCTVPQSAIACSANSYGKSKCVKSEIPCSNGCIFIIDAVQMPSFLTNPEVFQAEEITVTETLDTPAESKPAANTPAANTPAANTPAANTPAESKPAANAPAANTPTESAPAANTPAPTESKPAETPQMIR